MSEISHPFFCEKKRCRKTAWDTPEYLSEGDWDLVQGVVDALLSKDRSRFDAIIKSREAAEAFFYRVCGWPEGLNYYWSGSSSARDFYFSGFVLSDPDRDLSRMQVALGARHGELFAAMA